MANNIFDKKIHDSIENYYNYKPDTLMPLLMVALAAQGKLSVSDQENGVVFCSIDLNEVMNYEWVKLDPVLRKQFKKYLSEGKSTIKVTGNLDESLKDIYQTFHHYDTYTVEQEYHHRIGVLYHHSCNEASEHAHREYATYCLATVLQDSSREFLQDCFLSISNFILFKSGLQPERPRLKVAQTLYTLLDYDGKGIVYNPFAGCAIAAAMIHAGDRLYADGDTNDKLFAAARLLNYGTGGNNAHVIQRNSLEWLNDFKIDYVMSTYRGYINGKSAFDFCLSKCFDTLADTGKFAGIVSPKDIFEHQSDEMKEALKRDWIETIVLLPFGEVAVLVNANKSLKMKKQVRFYNLNHPMLSHRPIISVLSDENYANFFKVSDIKKKDFLKNFLTSELPEREGCVIVKLSDFVSKIRKQTYSLSRVPEDQKVMAYIDRKQTYNMYKTVWMNDIDKKNISFLFAPAYHLSCDSLITNSKGKLEPRLFDADLGTAYFQDGYAFSIKPDAPFDAKWLMTQLNEPYVKRQLHPYGMDEMVPEAITENQILNLSLYKESENQQESDDDDSNNLEGEALPMGFELSSEHIIYTIHKFLGHGSFGYAYSALSHNLLNGEEKEVVLKEFFPCMDFHREGDELRAVVNEITNFEIDTERQKFCVEAEIMRRLGHTPDSHIVPAEELFKCEKTDTMYYVMPFYHAGSLQDLQNSGTNFSEELVLKHIVEPLCKALHIAHANRVLHLDIKPENILIDENGDAALTDFGVAKQYNDEGLIINRFGVHGTGAFAAPEMRVLGSAMIKFGSEPDIFGLAATIYNLVTNSRPHPIKYNSDEDTELRYFMKEANVSDKFADAIVAGLQDAAPARPANAQAFLNMFPGFEDVKL